jgi:tetratricopeptide (TPR) repeat protein
LIDKAVVYLQQAGERAARLWANEEAIRHLNAGLALLQTLPETPERDQQELSMQLALAAPLQAVKGYAATETGRAYARARELVMQVHAGETFQKIQIFGLLAGYYHMRAEHEKCIDLYERTEETARQMGHQPLAAAARAGKGSALMMTGQFPQAFTYLKEMADLYDPQQRLTLIIGQDIGSSAHAGAALVLWLLGFPDKALDYSQMALSLAEASQHPFSQCFVRLHAGLRFHLFRGEHAQASRHLASLTSLAAAERFPYFEIVAMIHGGWLLVEKGQVQSGIAQIRKGLIALERMGTEMDKPYHLGLLADACRRVGQVQEGLQLVTQGLSVVERTGEHFYEAELYRLRGDLLAQSGARDEGEVTACYERAVEVARSQRAKSWELRATVRLCRQWQEQGRRKEAQQRLAEIYRWFTEGFETPDLKEAEALQRSG